MSEVDVAIVGAGIGGLTAALGASTRGLTVALFEGLGPGGELLNLALVDGEAGPDRAASLLEQALDQGAELRFEEATAVAPGRVESALGGCTARAVIVATGAAPRRLGLPGEAEHEGRGVSYCASCDGALFRGQPVAVLAGGPYAAVEAEHLAELASSVVVLAEPLRIEGDDDGVRGVTYRGDDGSERFVEARGVFVCAGPEPRTAIVDGVVKLDGEGRIVVDETMATSAPGIYAIGDVRAGAPYTLASAVADARTAVATIV